MKKITNILYALLLCAYVLPAQSANLQNPTLPTTHPIIPAPSPSLIMRALSVITPNNYTLASAKVMAKSIRDCSIFGLAGMGAGVFMANSVCRNSLAKLAHYDDAKIIIYGVGVLGLGLGGLIAHKQYQKNVNEEKEKRDAQEAHRALVVQRDNLLNTNNTLTQSITTNQATLTALENTQQALIQQKNTECTHLITQLRGTENALHIMQATVLEKEAEIEKFAEREKEINKQFFTVLGITREVLHSTSPDLLKIAESKNAVMQAALAQDKERNKLSVIHLNTQIKMLETQLEFATHNHPNEDVIQKLKTEIVIIKEQSIETVQKLEELEKNYLEAVERHQKFIENANALKIQQGRTALEQLRGPANTLYHSLPSLGLRNSTTSSMLPYETSNEEID